MTVAVFIEKESDAECLIEWGVDFAAADHAELLIVVPRRSKGKQDWESLNREGEDLNPLAKVAFAVLAAQDKSKAVLKEDIASGMAPSDHSLVAIEVRELISPDPAKTFVEEVEDLNIRLLLLPAPNSAKTDRAASEWNLQLYLNAPCEAIAVRGRPPRNQCRILIASDNENDPNSISAIKRGCQLAAASVDGSITLLFVRPDDDEVAKQIAEKHLEKLARRVTEKKIELEKTIQLADNLVAGVKLQDWDEYDLVLLGTRKIKTLAALLREGEALDETTTAVAGIRQAVPVSAQLWSRFQTAVRSKVPQIERELRISLVDRLQTNSAFNFDFAALISLSTLIAALGLARNSGAVVIGAMLVAPLMTPLVAIGFSLVQGNEKLIRSAIKSVLLGFTVAFAIGATLGLMLHFSAPTLQATTEMYGRDWPNFLDLIVALASGVAGAYAMGRPNLVSALPGVAIAAALVPPIATSGLALTMGHIALFGGSLLLFATNIVAIMFWAVGIDNRASKNQSGEARSQLRWPRYCFLGLVILSFLLAAEMLFFNPLE
jgi:uncharacterized hydrophobic protein (TIGR00271 family)